MEMILKRTAAFVRLVRSETKKHRIKFLLVNEEFVDIGDGMPSSGYFDAGTRTLAVATGKALEEWLSILVHEYCHFLQWREKALVWKKTRIDSRDAIEIFEHYLVGRRVATDTLDQAIQALIQMELDCERRTTVFIRKRKLPIDVKKYIQKANAYLMFYHEAKRRRCWYDPKTPPYTIESIWAKMPSDFDSLDYCDFTQINNSKWPDYTPAMPKKVDKTAA